MMATMLEFTGMGGPMGVETDFDTDRCRPGGMNCVARDNEGYYEKPGACHSVAPMSATIALAMGDHRQWRSFVHALRLHWCLDRPPC
jgi:hypothetical protein